MGVTWHSEELRRIQNWYFLTIFSIFGIFACARILRINARVLRYYRSRRTGNQFKMLRILLETQNMSKNGVSTFRTCYARTRGNFWNAQNGLKRVVNLKWSHLEHLKILTRAYAYVMARARMRVHLNVDPWPEINVYQIWFKNNFALWRYAQS